MATSLNEVILKQPFKLTQLSAKKATSTGSSEDFSFKLNDCGDNMYNFGDARTAEAGNYYISFDKGDYANGKAIAEQAFTDGMQFLIPIESGNIEKKGGTAGFKIRFVGISTLGQCNLFVSAVKIRPVTNN